MNIGLTSAALQKEHNPATRAPQETPCEKAPDQLPFSRKSGFENSHFKKTRSAEIILSKSGNLCLFRREPPAAAAKKARSRRRNSIVIR
jgi:hypothetical protein